MPEWWSFAAAKGDGDVIVPYLPHEVDFLPNIFSLHDLEPPREELQCTLLSTEESHLGTLDEVCERIEARRDRGGFSYTVVQGDAMEAMAPAFRVATKDLPGSRR